MTKQQRSRMGIWEDRQTDRPKRKMTTTRMKMITLARSLALAKATNAALLGNMWTYLALLARSLARLLSVGDLMPLEEEGMEGKGREGRKKTPEGR